MSIFKLMQPWVDLTRLSIEWTRYWLDYAEMACDTIEVES
jgi:hypothetical protein